MPRKQKQTKRKQPMRKRSMKRKSMKRKSIKKYKMKGGAYDIVTYNGLPKDKGNTRVYFPGGSATFNEMIKEIAGGDGPNDTA